MNIAQDLNRGAAAIRDVVFGPQSGAKGLRQIYRLLETGALPAFKLGDVWHMRTSTYLEYLSRLEQEAATAKSCLPPPEGLEQGSRKLGGTGGVTSIHASPVNRG